MQYTLNDVTEFCFANRRTNGFKAFTKTQVAETVVWAAKNQKLVFVVDGQGLCGAGIYTAVPGIKIIYTHHIVAVRLGFKSLVSYALTNYPGYRISGSRRGKMKVFNLA